VTLGYAGGSGGSRMSSTAHSTVFAHC
jgi:hypothetical protein